MARNNTVQKRKVLFPMVIVENSAGLAVLQSQTWEVEEEFILQGGRGGHVMEEVVQKRTFQKLAASGGGVVLTAIGVDDPIRPPKVGLGFNLSLTGLFSDWSRQQIRQADKNAKSELRGLGHDVVDRYFALVRAKGEGEADLEGLAKREQAAEELVTEIRTAAKAKADAGEADPAKALEAKADKVAGAFERVYSRGLKRQTIFRKVLTQDGSRFSLLAFIDEQAKEFVILMSGGGFRTTLDHRIESWIAAGVRVSHDLKTGHVKSIELKDAAYFRAYPQLLQRDDTPGVVVVFTMITFDQGTWPVLVFTDETGTVGFKTVAECFVKKPEQKPSLLATGKPDEDTIVEADLGKGIGHYRFVRSYHPGKKRPYRTVGEGAFHTDVSGFGPRNQVDMESENGSDWHCRLRDLEDAEGDSIGAVTVPTNPTTPPAK